MRRRPQRAIVEAWFFKNVTKDFNYIYKVILYVAGIILYLVLILIECVYDSI